MATIQQEGPESGQPRRMNTLADRVTNIERENTLLKRNKETVRDSKDFKWPFKWMRKFKQANKKRYTEMALVVFLNKKNQIEPPKFMPIYDGNMVVWKNKPYEFDPRALWTVQGMKGNPQAYLIKEIDRRPVRNKHGNIVYGNASVSNMDIEEIRARGDSTESDEFLIKAALKAQTAQLKKGANIMIIAIVAIILIGGLIWFLAKG